jgi:hypothetical protein
MKEGRKEDHIKIFLLFISLLFTPVSTDKEPNKYADCGHKYIYFLTLTCFHLIGHLQEEYFRYSLMTLKGLLSLNA